MKEGEMISAFVIICFYLNEVFLC